MIRTVAIERWSWLGEPLAADFANTVRRRGFEYEEHLQDAGDLVDWAAHEGIALTKRDIGPRLGEVRELRDAVFAILLAATKREPTPHGSERRVNAALAAVPLVPQLVDGRVELTAPGEHGALDELLARIAASLLELLESPALAFCDAPSCGQFFLRHRGDQRWCGASCGTRARVARHAAHRR
jgi:predicted RNA-binding Zn ribbon-like protein